MLTSEEIVNKIKRELKIINCIRNIILIYATILIFINITNNNYSPIVLCLLIIILFSCKYVIKYSPARIINNIIKKYDNNKNIYKKEKIYNENYSYSKKLYNFVLEKIELYEIYPVIKILDNFCNNDIKKIIGEYSKIIVGFINNENVFIYHDNKFIIYSNNENIEEFDIIKENNNINVTTVFKNRYLICLNKLTKIKIS